MSADLRTPLARVRGLGSAKEGVSHWWWQRLTAIALVPLCVWLVWFVTSLLGADYNTVRASVAKPLNGGLLMAFVVALFYHGQLGLQVVIEDYIHHRPLEIFLQIAVKFGAFLFAAASVLAVLRIMLGS
jgi:succinate dehydrogenase / fumarate reductase membrane anchor subunit